MSYRDVFKKNVDEYEKITQSEYIQLIFDLEKEVLDKFFNNLGSMDKVLMDFACGSGRWTQYLETKFDNVLGVDVSEEMIRYARQKCSRARFIVTDITTNDEIKGQFDVITAFRFYKNAEQKLREGATQNLVKYINNDGYFIFDLHLNTWSVMGIMASTMKLLRIDKLFKISPLTVRTVSLNDIKPILKENNLEIVDYFGMGLLPSRSNYLILPRRWLHKFESFLMRRKFFRRNAYNLLVIAKKI